MKKNGLYYFKRALVLIIPIAIYTILSGLFELEDYNINSISWLLAKGAFVGIVTGVFLGFLNLFARIDTIYKKDSDLY